MRQGDIIQQADGCRHLYQSPRGTIAIDVHDDGSQSVTVCVGYAGSEAQRRRDLRDAATLHTALLEEEV